MMMDPNVERKF